MNLLRRGFLFYYCLLGGGIGALGYLLFLPMPLFQDDLVFLYHAREAWNHDVTTWLLRPSGDKIFWRPLSVGLHWLALGALPGEVVAPAAHVANITMLALAAAAVSWAALGVIQHWHRDIGLSRLAAVAGAFLYAAHPAWMLPGAWPSAIQESYAVFFSALAVGWWTISQRNHGRRFSLFLAAAVAYMAALASKEGAVLVPLIALLCISQPGGRHFTSVFFWRRWFFVFGPVTLAWFAMRAQAVSSVPDYSTYRMVAGSNVIRNGASLAAFALGMPREALLGAVVHGSRADLLPGAGMVGLIISNIALLIFALRPISKAVALRAILFCGLTLSPYIMLQGNCYPYYLATALALYPLLAIAAWPRLNRFAQIWLIGSAMGAFLLMAFVQFSPGEYKTAARARRAQNQLEILARNLAALQAVREKKPILIRVDSTADYVAGGYLAGLALALGISQDQMKEVETGETSSSQNALVIAVTKNGYEAPAVNPPALQP